MPVSGSEIWLTLVVGTFVLLGLGGILVASIISGHRKAFTIEREKLEALERSEEKYSDLFHNVSDLVYVHLLDGTVVQINRAVERLFHYSPEQVCGRKLHEFFTLKEKVRVERYLSDMSTLGEKSGLITLRGNRGLERILEYRSSVVQKNQERIAVRGIARDVTAQVQTARSLRRSERRARILFDTAESMRENLEILSREILRIQEEERSRMSRELHDEVGQLLTAVTVNIEILRKTPPEKVKEFMRRLDDSGKLIEQLFETIHRFSTDLRPAALDQLGLLPAIRSHAAKFAERTGIRVVITEDPSIELLTDDRKIALYRVVQESLTNVSKHTEAELIRMEFNRENSKIKLTIEDTGLSSGENGNPLEQTERLGILGMRERLRLAGGEFNIESIPGMGTRITVRVPLTP